MTETTPASRPAHDAEQARRRGDTFPSGRTPRHRSMLLDVVLMSLLPACAGADQGVERTTGDTGAEILTITRAVDSYGPVGTVGAEPDLQLSSMTENPIDIFGSVRGVRAFPDGEIVVAEGQQGMLAFFDASGRPLRTIGGRGEAPGQFRALSQIAMVNEDSLWVWDQQATRITVFERSGVVARLMRFVAPDPDRSYNRTFVLPDRTFIAVSDARVVPPPARLETGQAFERDTVEVDRRDDLGDLTAKLVSFPGGENLRVWQSPQPNVMMNLVAPLPFRRTGYYTVAGSWIVGGPNDRFELQWWSFEGELDRVTRFPALDRPITPADVAALRSQWVEDAGDSPARLELVNLAFDQAPVPATFPAFSAILAGADGAVWVRERTATPTESARWWRFASESGLPTGYVRFPEGLDVHEIGADYVLGVWRDPTGLQHVRKYSLTLE